MNRPIEIALVSLSALALAFVGTAPLSAQALPVGNQLPGPSGCDDCNVAVSLTGVFPEGVRLGATTYTQMYIGSNGYVTFGHGNSGYSPTGIAGYSQGPIIAPQFDDLDPSKGGDIYYNQDAGAGHVVATWQGVAPYSSPVSGSGENTFQVILRTISGDPTDFQIEIRYIALNWARSGNIGGWPTAGWSVGDQLIYAELPESGQSTFRNLQSGSNVGSPGIYRWDVIGGIVQGPPIVGSTSAASSIGATAANSGGSIASDGGYAITARGVAYGTKSHPTVAQDTVHSASSEVSFSAEMTGLAAGTTYYVRAFATNALGTGYGPQVSFTTLSIVPPSVTTLEADSVAPTSAQTEGSVTNDGGAPVTQRGVAYGTDPNPGIAGATVTAGSGVGGFAAALSDLTPNTTYYVRAYATNSAGTGYGAQDSFTTPKIPQTIAFPELAPRSYGDAVFALSAEASSALPVSYLSSNLEVATVSDGVVTIVGAGSAVITASQGGNDWYYPAPEAERTLMVSPKAIEGTVTVQPVKVYDDGTGAVVTGRGLVGIETEDLGQVSLVGGEANYADRAVGAAKVVRLTGATLAGARAQHYRLVQVIETLAQIVPGSPDHLTIEGPTGVVAGAISDTLIVTVRDAFGNPTVLEEGSVTLTLSTDTEPASAVFGPAPERTLRSGDGSLTFTYSNQKSGGQPHKIRAVQSEGVGLPGAWAAEHSIAVLGGGVHSFRFEAVGGGAIGAQPVDESWTIRISAVDALGNVAKDFHGTVVLSADGPLLTGGGTTAVFEAGVLTHEVGFATPGTFTITVAAEGPTTGASAPIEVRAPAPRLAIVIETDNPTPALGSVVNIDVVVTNVGPRRAHNVEVRSPIEGQNRLEAEAVTVDRGTVPGAGALWTIGQLEPGESATMRIRARVLVP